MPVVAATAAGVLALLPMVGWATGARALLLAGSEGTPMLPLTSIGFVLLSAAVVISWQGGARWHWVADAAAVFVLLLGGAALVAVLQQLHGPDYLLFGDRVRAAAFRNGGWPAPNTALGFVLSASGLLLVRRSVGVRLVTGQVMVALAAVIAILAAAGYAYGVGRLYGLAAFTPMALSTATAFLLLTAAILHLRSAGVMKAVTGDTVGAVSGRRLLPAAVLLPLALGWAALAGERAGFYDRAFATSLVVVGMIVLFSLLVWLNANSLRHIDLRRRAAERERTRLLEAEQRARKEAERRAREEVALRRAAEAVTTSFTIDDVIREIAEGAVVATGADGAFVQRVDHDLERVEVVGVAGTAVPEHGSTGPFQGSFAEQVIETEESVLIEDLSREDSPVLEGVAGSGGTCAALILPLMDGGSPIGALVLTRTAPGSPFTEDEVERAHTFAELAALAFRKVHLLHESERRREEVERVTESRTRLIRGFSHDLKNPLGAADGHLQLLEDEVLGPLADRQRTSIERARRAIGEGLRLIDDLVALARAEAGQIELVRQPVDLREAAREIGEEYRATAERKGLGLRLEIPDRFPLIESDSTRVRQVLGNLVSNAVKYTDGGHVAVRLAVRRDGGDQRRTMVAVEVEDTGVGIREDELRFLFQEFTRLSPDEREGIGLGLAISQRVAEALGGRIVVRSEHGVGSTFAFLLPRQPSGAHDLGEADADEVRSTSGQRETP